MTPKEKAKELYDKFYEWYPKQDAEFIAEQSVITFANEMINNAGFIWGVHDFKTNVTARDSFRMYWQEVKQEIEKL